MPDIETFIVKVCGITSAEDAQVAVEAGANALGFNFYPKSPRYVTPAQARAIVEEVPGRYLRVGVFVNVAEPELLTIADEAKLDVLQLHGDSCEIPRGSRYRIWRAIPGETAAVDTNDGIEAYLLDTATPGFGGSGKTFRWELASAFQRRVIVAGGLDAGNVASAIEALHPWGVDACSRLESRPGRKDRRRVESFIHAAFQASQAKMVSK
ncbi:MAG TPA: phosphoribosylanthranilate isomerase [Bryobacteraceae bacterium]|jgi:phosphoribosylanthranilate isomerase|nr:phosphoribosylanthranilate isomerase [Bryobacteraceae bacterium]